VRVRGKKFARRWEQSPASHTPLDRADRLPPHVWPVGQRNACAGYLGHLFAELDGLRFNERAFLSKHMRGTYNHYH